MPQPTEPEQLNVTALIKDAREIMALLGVTAAADVLPALTRRLAEPEPQQADEPALLDLVQQHGDVRFETGTLLGVGDRDAFMASRGLAETLFARIAALVPQQPVQARCPNGVWWWHPCGAIYGAAEQTVHECSWSNCTNPNGPWRPLLVAADAAPDGDRAPEANRFGVSGWTHEDGTSCPEYLAPPDERTWWCTKHEMRVHREQPQPDLMAQVMAELGVDRSERLLGAVTERLALSARLADMAALRERERDEARAEVERLELQVRAEIEQACDKAAWADRLAREALERTGVHETEEASGTEELWGLALDALTSQPDQLVLRLPEVPEGAVLIGEHTSYRWTWHESSGGWCSPNRGPISLGRLLAVEGTVRVELAPPREPRTWPKLDPVPDDLRHVRGASGTVYARSSGTFAFNGYRNGQSITRSLHALQEEDGPLTEALDREAGLPS